MVEDLGCLPVGHNVSLSEAIDSVSEVDLVAPGTKRP